MPLVVVAVAPAAVVVAASMPEPARVVPSDFLDTVVVELCVRNGLNGVVVAIVLVDQVFPVARKPYDCVLGLTSSRMDDHTARKTLHK
eukprot:1870201-Amphidinium_carterae.1